VLGMLVLVSLESDLGSNDVLAVTCPLLDGQFCTFPVGQFVALRLFFGTGLFTRTVICVMLCLFRCMERPIADLPLADRRIPLADR
jgi:hypothetical protein